MSKENVIFLGHFQPFHNGHVDCFSQICALDAPIRRLFIAVACSDIGDVRDNPFSFVERSAMIRSFLNSSECKKLVEKKPDMKVSIVPVPMLADQEKYAEHVCECIKHASCVDVASTNTVVFCSADSYTRGCFAKFELIDVKRTIDVNSAQVREMMQRSLPWKYFVPSGVADIIDDVDGARRCSILLGRPHRNPTPTADVIMEALCRDGKTHGIVLIKRKNKPIGWALPGGFVDYGEDVWEAARREAQEETTAVCNRLYLLGVYGSPDRDPRSHTQTTVFVARFEDMVGEHFIGSDDAAEAQVFSLDSLPEPIVFDHARIIADYKRMKDSGVWPFAFRTYN